jgi:hypothetical protein
VGIVAVTGSAGDCGSGVAGAFASGSGLTGSVAATGGTAAFSGLGFGLAAAAFGFFSFSGA